MEHYMAEQRLIDATMMAVEECKAYLSDLNSGKIKPDTQGESYAIHWKIQQLIANTPTVDPETLLIVQKLREELATVTAERDVLTYLLDRAGEAEELTEKAYKERDAAICRLAAIEDILGDDYDLDRLRELVEADREKRCVVLPCEVGRTVYMPFCDEIVKMRIGQFHINGYTSQRIWAEIDCDWAATKSVRWDLSFGKTVFLTREAAEDALKGEQNGKDY